MLYIKMFVCGVPVYFGILLWLVRRRRAKLKEHQEALASNCCGHHIKYHCTQELQNASNLMDLWILVGTVLALFSVAEVGRVFGVWAALSRYAQYIGNFLS